MKINENKEIFMEVRFGDLKPGDTFVDYDVESGDALYYIVCGTRTVVDLKNGDVRCCDPDALVVPVEITGDVKWPTKVIKRK